LVVVCGAAFLLCTVAHDARAALTLYINGDPAPEFSGYIIEPLVIGIHSNRATEWDATLLAQTSAFAFYYPQFNPAKGPLGDPTATPIYDGPPFGYELDTYGFLSPGLHFTTTFDYGGPHETLVTLWDHASVFDIPVDTTLIYQGLPPPILESSVTADAGGTYQLAPGGSVTFDGTGSMETVLLDEPPGDPQWYTSYVWDGRSPMWWSINGTHIGYGATPTLDYDTLVSELGLTPGTYDLTLDVTSYWVGEDSVTTTLSIVPEPGTVSLVLIGAA
jgi:hypothetical protein